MQDDAPTPQDEIVGFKTERQLRRLLNIQDILPVDEEKLHRLKPKRRRVSRSRSITASRVPKDGRDTGKPSYACPSRIADIFDQKISSEQLCALSAMRHGTPYDVRETMPDATVEQICQMCKL